MSDAAGEVHAIACGNSGKWRMSRAAPAGTPRRGCGADSRLQLASALRTIPLTRTAAWSDLVATGYNQYAVVNRGEAPATMVRGRASTPSMRVVSQVEGEQLIQVTEAPAQEIINMARKRHNRP